MSMIIIGTKNGLRRRGPCAAYCTTWSWNSFIPPMPDPTITPMPVRSSSDMLEGSMPASASASSAATMAYWANGSRRRASLRSR